MKNFYFFIFKKSRDLTGRLHLPPGKLTVCWWTFVLGLCLRLAVACSFARYCAHDCAHFFCLLLKKIFIRSWVFSLCFFLPFLSFLAFFYAVFPLLPFWPLLECPTILFVLPFFSCSSLRVCIVSHICVHGWYLGTPLTHHIPQYDLWRSCADLDILVSQFAPPHPCQNYVLRDYPCLSLSCFAFAGC